MGGDRLQQNSETLPSPFPERHLEPVRRKLLMVLTSSITNSNSFKSKDSSQKVHHLCLHCSSVVFPKISGV